MSIPAPATSIEEELLHQRYRLVERIVASESLNRSERLCSLLRYVCELTLSGHSAEINEQSVGEAVFGRPKDYDSSIDGIVRTQASRLRKSLQTYFDTEGRHEPVRIVIPRGSYVPIFEPAHSPTLASLPVAEPGTPPPTAPPDLPFSSSETTPATSPHPQPKPHLLPWLLVALLAAACIFLGWRLFQSSQPAALSESPLWNNVFLPGQTTLLVNGDSSLVNYQNFARRSVSLEEYVAGDYRTEHPEKGDAGNFAASLANRRYTSVVDLEIDQQLTLLADKRQARAEIRFPREIRPNDLKESNLVLIGSPEATPWVTLFEQNMNFVFQYDRSDNKTLISVINRHPHPGEPAQWTAGTNTGVNRVYAVVAYQPNLSRTGSVLILEGISMAGTECAWDFVADAKKSGAFLNSIRRPDGRLPYFEVVLGTNNIGGSAVDASVVSVRTDET